MSFIDFSVLDIIDIALVAFLLYQLYRLIRGTVAINIFLGVAAIYLIWKLVEALQMELLSEILGKFIGVGVLALVIVFQQEIRRFLLVLGSTNFTRRRKFLKQLKWLRSDEQELDLEEIEVACINMARSKTGALIVIERQSQLGFYSETGTVINGRLSSRMLESIFFKNAPLHDGAVIISGDRIVAAGCILPVTEKTTIPRRFGLRHRAGIGVAEKTDALAIVISEETGDISFAIGEVFQNKIETSQFSQKLRAYLEK
ncbi:MAG: TIGR00159 family protein [Owenweeksia sp.]|nr:TIGR00159 family protein [Owenweeksia sp.]MBF98635.1 TIGR00159 family protein [Owenweeksia sp.]HBF21909.1 TIGR00159 family protein [Cryomorphaceae bacterium]HCQ16483.1 TIGR00159 family protein [Cryomorphaceae bacterium]|tara:strand:+ start:191 stop:964 length:774 start_codon:yes stop_codon:yes gene_type:complete